MYSSRAPRATDPLGITRTDDDRRLALLLAGLGCALLLGTLFAAFVLPQSPGRTGQPSVDLFPALPLWSLAVALPLDVPRDGATLARALLATSVTQFAAYGMAIYLAWRRPAGRLSLSVAVAAALVCYLVAACALPNVNRDIFNYILSGRVAAAHGQNPHYVPPSMFPDDPLYRYASSQYTGFPGDNKLPAWTLLNVGLARIAGGDPVTSLLLYRATFLLFNVANVVLIVRTLRVVQPRRELAGALLYAWNPIVIGYAQSKVDTVMVFFLLLAAYWLARGRRGPAIVALAISALVKLITLPLAAVYWLHQLRARDWRGLAATTLLLGATSAALYAPFWQGPDLLWMHVGLLGGGKSLGPQLFQLAARGAFVAAVLWAAWRQDGRIAGLFSGWALVMLVFALFLTRLGFSWYLMTLIALAALAAERYLTPITIAVSFASFLLNAWDAASSATFRLPKPLALPRASLYLAFVSVVVLAAVAFEMLRRARRRI